MSALAAVHAIDVNADDHVALDDEGGAAVQNSKTRFIEPALALLALRGSLEQGEGRGFDGGAVEARPTSVSGGGGNGFARGVGGLIGFGAIGFVLGPISRPLGIAFSAVGAARTVYKKVVLGKGQDYGFRLTRQSRSNWRRGCPINDEQPIDRGRAVGRDRNGSDSAQQPAFRVETRLVVLRATVRNSHGIEITNLEQDAFAVNQNGRRQPIAVFRKEDIPVSIGLLLDNSGSMRPLRSRVEAAALDFVRASTRSMNRSL